MPRIVFAPKFPKALHDVLMEMKPAGFDLVATEPSGPEFFSAVKGADYFMGFARNPLGPDFYAAAPNMKLVQLISAGYNTVDLEAARRARVPVANNGGANSVAVAEHAVMLILATMKKLHWQHNNVTAGKWRVGDFAETRFYELEGKTVGIVGLGNIGKKVARRLRGFECKIVYYDIIRLPEHDEDALGVRYVLFDELLAIADLCIHFQSGAVLEAAFAGVPSLSVVVPQDHLHGYPTFGDVFGTRPGSLQAFPGVVWSVDHTTAAARLRGASLADFRMNPEARRRYVREYVGFDDTRSSVRVLETIERAAR